MLTKRPERVKDCLPKDWGRKSGISFIGKPIHFELYDDWGYPIADEDRYKPVFRERCNFCGMQPICNGCGNCGKCDLSYGE